MKATPGAGRDTAGHGAVDRGTTGQRAAGRAMGGTVMPRTAAGSKALEMLCVGLGCATGAVLRFLVQQAVAPLTYDDVAIMIVNVIGCGILGLCTAYVTQRHSSPLLRKFLTTGFCGGLTTFSSFCGDTFQMLQHRPGLALAFVAGNMVLGMAAYCATGRVRFMRRGAAGA